MDPLILEEDWLRQKYIDEGFSSAQIARMTGRDSVAILNYLKTYSIPRRRGCYRVNTGKWHEFCSGESNLNWRGGKSFEPYPPAFNEAFKQKIRERDNYTCSICGSHWEEGNPAYPVHHINYVKNDTVPENCIALCQSCHAKTNADRGYWQKRLIGNSMAIEM